MEDFWKSVQTIQAERGADYRAFSLFSATHWAELLGAAAVIFLCAVIYYRCREVTRHQILRAVFVLMLADEFMKQAALLYTGQWNALENKNVITRFPSLSSRCTTVQVLKSPKTDSSIRTIFLPKTVAEMLVHYKAEQDMTKDALGAEYADYNLVVAGPLGMPTEQSTINGALKQLIEENDLPKVVFHSFRHSSITYKLKLNGGDIKAVQGDSGHAQASMVTEQYAHILDDDRRLNAQRFDDFFYQHHGAEPEVLPRAEQSTPKASPVDTDAAAALAKLLADPSMATLIKNLAKNL